jgi:glycosyltransferase involved in cell wall biosynthesis
MKILLVAIPNHHFFQWVKQLKDSGFEVYWFDITDGAGFVEKISWVTQYNGWKLKLDYPFRYKIKNNFPKLHKILQKITINKTEKVFEKIANQIQPDVVHCFEMQLAGLPILSVMQKSTIPFIYSSWGSDLFDYQNLGVTKTEAITFLQRVDYLITDCKRDFTIAKNLGFTNNFLGVFPGNGGIEIENDTIQPLINRKTICIKGYEDGVGKAIQALKAIEIVSFDEDIDFLIFSADDVVLEYINDSKYFKNKKVEIYSRNSFISNQLLLQKFGKCLIYIGNSSSDGMPNSLLEAMGMGIFPIQSNPGNVSEEVISNGINGLLIQDSKDSSEIANHIQNAVSNMQLLENAKTYNTKFISVNYNRTVLQDKIVSLYSSILNKN